MATATATDKKGMKRICPSCSTRYYDFNKRPVVCPNCKMEFTGEIKLKARRRSAANDLDEGQVSPATAAERTAGDGEEEEEIEEGEDGVVSLEDLDEDKDIDDEDEADIDIEDDIDVDDDLDEEDEDEDDDLDEDEDEDIDDEDDGGKKSRKKK